MLNRYLIVLSICIYLVFVTLLITLGSYISSIAISKYTIFYTTGITAPIFVVIMIINYFYVCYIETENTWSNSLAMICLYNFIPIILAGVNMFSKIKSDSKIIVNKNDLLLILITTIVGILAYYLFLLTKSISKN